MRGCSVEECDKFEKVGKRAMKQMNEDGEKLVPDRKAEIAKLDHNGKVLEVYSTISGAARFNGIREEHLRAYLKSERKKEAEIEGFLYARNNPKDIKRAVVAMENFEKKREILIDHLAIRDLMEEQDITPIQLSDNSTVSRTSIYRILRGEAEDLSDKTIEKLAGALGCDRSVFIKKKSEVEG